MTNKYTLAALIGLATILPLKGSMVISGDFQYGTPQPTVQITQKIDVTILTTGAFRTLIFDNWMISEYMNASLVNANNYVNQMVIYQINNGPALSIAIELFRDNINYTTGALNPGDGYFYFNTAINVVVGDLLSFKPTTLRFTPDPSFTTPPATFNGPFFVTTVNGTRLSSSTTNVPEPGYALLSALVLPYLLLRRRRL